MPIKCHQSAGGLTSTSSCIFFILPELFEYIGRSAIQGTNWQWPYIYIKKIYIYNWGCSEHPPLLVHQVHGWCTTRLNGARHGRRCGVRCILSRASRNLTNPPDGTAYQTNWPSGGPKHPHKIVKFFSRIFFLGQFWPLGGQLVWWARSSKVKVIFWVTLILSIATQTNRLKLRISDYTLLCW